MVSTQGLNNTDTKTVHFIEKHFKNSQVRLRGMDTKGKNKPLQSTCLLCLNNDNSHPNHFYCCINCVNKLAQRFGKVGMNSSISIVSKKPFIPQKECEYCHKKETWHCQVNVLLCPKCLQKVNKKITEATIWDPRAFQFSISKPLRKPFIKRPAMWQTNKRAW